MSRISILLPAIKKIVGHLTNGLFLVPPKHTRRSSSKRNKMLRPKAGGNRRQGFASMNKARLFQITSAAGKAAHAMGRAHKWKEARRAGRIGGSKPKRARDQDMTPDSKRSQMIQILKPASASAASGTRLIRSSFRSMGRPRIGCATTRLRPAAGSDREGCPSPSF
jgi:hypothetical protein